MHITVNGKEMDVNLRIAFEVRGQIGEQTDIVILNGFQIDQDCTISENDSLSIMPAIKQI